MRITLALAALLLTPAAIARAEPTLVDGECDPFPFATGRYGCQLGVRHPALHGVRISAAFFSVDVPDVVTEIGGNDGFHLDVRPGSGGLYAFYYFNPAGQDGFAVGGSLRLLRQRFEHDDFPGMHADVTELSPEANAAYQWHPFGSGFYLQAWIGLSITAYRDGDRVVGDRTYDGLPVQPFFTVNLGYEHAL